MTNHKYHWDHSSKIPVDDDYIDNNLVHTTNIIPPNNHTHPSFDDEVNNYTEPSVLLKVIAFLWLVNLFICFRKTRRDEIERNERNERRRIEREEEEEKKSWLEPARREKEIEKQIVTRKIMMSSDGTMSICNNVNEFQTCPVDKKILPLPLFTIDDYDAPVTTTSMIPISPSTRTNDLESKPKPKLEPDPPNIRTEVEAETETDLETETETDLETEAETEAETETATATATETKTETETKIDPETESSDSFSIPSPLKTTINSDNNTELTCSICLENLFSIPSASTSNISISWSRHLHCHHIFHSSCLHSWLMTGSDECPICRTVLLRRQCDNCGEEGKEEGGEGEVEGGDVENDRQIGARAEAIDRVVDEHVVLRRGSRQHRRRWRGRSYHSGSQVADGIGSGTGGVWELAGRNVETGDDIEAVCSRSLGDGGEEQEEQQDTMGHGEEGNVGDTATISDGDRVDTIVSDRRRKKNRKRYVSLQNRGDDEDDEDPNRCLV